jgi:group I intron endonuclease
VIFINKNYSRSKKDYNNSGIYCIINNINQKRYVGQACDLKQRKIRHMSDLKCGRHHNNHLQYSYNKYGEDCFDFIILETCEISLLNEREIYWMEYYNVLDSGYNQSVGGVGCMGYRHTEEEIAKMRQIQNPKPVYQLDKDGHFIKEWTGASHAGKCLDIPVTNIKKSCNRENGTRQSGGYIWIYKEDFNSVDMSYYFEKNKNSPKPINQYDLDMNFIQRWGSVTEAETLGGFRRSEISRVCHNKRKTHCGFIFRFAENNE